MTAKRPDTVIIGIPKIPGYFTELAYKLASELKRKGLNTIFVCTTPFNQKYKKVALSELGKVYYLCDYIRKPINQKRIREIEIDWWKTYPTFVRTSYFYGRHINNWEDYKKAVCFFEMVLANHKEIALVWSEIASSAFLCLLYEVAQKRGIPYLGYISGRLPGVFNVQLDLQSKNYMLNAEPPALKPTRQNEKPEYMNNPGNKLLSYPFFSVFPNTVRKLWHARNTLKYRSIENGNMLNLYLSVYFNFLLRKYRYLMAKNVFNIFAKNFEFPGDEISVLFPLQFRPEASTSVHAPFFENDQEVIKNVAFSLPSNSRLFVKEHPSAIGIRTLGFYRDIISYPNVYLLDVDVDLDQLLPKFDAVVTLTSTVGFQAIQVGVPVLLIGNAFYHDYPLVQQIESWSQLEKKLKKP